MTLNWCDTLKILQTQFEAVAARSPGLHHLFVEVADNERDKMFGPSWIAQSLTKTLPIVDGTRSYEKWNVCGLPGMPLTNPSFREPQPNETFDDSARVVKDGSGTIRAVPVLMKLRQAFYCGDSEVTTTFESLANSAAVALAGATNLNEHFFASDLTDIFRKPRGGVRYVFGDVPAAPKKFGAKGWLSGIAQFENGVVIDVPISESSPSACHWVLLLHRLGWRRIEGSGLRAERKAWHDNVEVALELLESTMFSARHGLASMCSKISKDSFYSVVGSKETPLDLSLASVFAIQLLLTDLKTNLSGTVGVKATTPNYSNEEWNRLPMPSFKVVPKDDAKTACDPAIGILVATEVERQAVLKRMRPPKSKRTVLQVHIGANTYFLGRFGVVEAVLCMSAMGSVGRDASTIVTTELIDEWNLPAVVILGIAFGKDSTKQQIGNVLVADRIISYESQRIGESTDEERGSQPDAGSVLLNRCRNSIGWHFPRPGGEMCGFQVGPMLSGEKLVDNPDFKRDLFSRFPTAIGGEMEGAGVASAASRKRREWIVVKAICDWGDGTKTKDHQEFAAASSVHFVEHILNQPGALDSLSK